MSRFIISRTGARIIEGRANGFSNSYLCWGLAEPPMPEVVIKDRVRQTLEALNLGPGQKRRIGRFYARPTLRAIGVCLAAGLLQHKDLQRPGELFAFTMEPDKGCPIQYAEDDLPIPPSTKPFFPIRVPRKPPREESQSIRVSSAARSYMTALLLGASDPEISAMIVSDGRNETKRLQKLASLGKMVQLAAHCVVNDVIEVPHEIFTDPNYMRPIIYTQPATLELPLDTVAPPH